MRTKTRLSGLTCIVLALVASGCTPMPETLTAEFDEERMEQAMAEARSTFDQFLERFRHPQPGDEAFCVKVGIQDDGATEHFWLDDLDLDGEPYSGTIQNDPGIVKTVHLGQRYTFSHENISDWMYLSEGTMQGNYTLRPVLESMPEDQAEALKREIGW